MLTVTSIVNLVQLQIYHTERPPLFAARSVMQRVMRICQRQLIRVPQFNNLETNMNSLKVIVADIAPNILSALYRKPNNKQTIYFLKPDLASFLANIILCSHTSWWHRNQVLKVALWTHLEKSGTSNFEHRLRI